MLFGLRLFSILIPLTLAFLLNTEVLCAETIAKPRLAIAYNKSQSGTASSNPDFDLTEKTINWTLAKYSKDLLLDIKYFDTREDAAGAVAAIKEINNYNPNIVVGFSHTFQALLAKKFLSKHIKLISPTATSNEILSGKNENIYLISNNNNYQAFLISKLIKQKFKSKTIYIIEISDSLYSSNFTEYISDELETMKKKYEIIKLYQSDFLQLSKLIKSLAPISEKSLIVFPSLEFEAGMYLSALSRKLSNFTLVGGDGWGTSAEYLKKIATSTDQEVFWISHYHFSSNYKKNLIFRHEFFESFNYNPIDTNAFWYEAINTSIAMIKNNYQWKKAIRSIPNVNEIVKIDDKYVKRRMALLKLKDRKVIFESEL